VVDDRLTDENHLLMHHDRISAELNIGMLLKEFDEVL